MTKPAHAIAGRFTRLPIRWRLAATSAALTFVILLAFAIVVGAFTARQVRDHFDDDLRATVGDLGTRVRPTTTPQGLELIGSDAIRSAAAGDAVVRVIRASDGRILVRPRGNVDLGSPEIALHSVGRYRVISRPIFSSQFSDPVAYIQYAKPRGSTNATIARVRLFLTAGVLGGALLALFAGLAVAGRAMAPIKRLTLAAKEIARTRDAAVVLPKPKSEDEVADLAHTLDDMLRELNAARTELETLLVRQREFVADASHELRTPLTSILANLELLEAALDGEDAEIVESALRSSRRMRGLVSDLLLLARADAKRERARYPVDLTEVIVAAAAEAAPLAAAHDLSVDVPGPLIVEGWADDLHRMILNLLENSLRHTPPDTPVRVAARAFDDRIEIVVEDEGPGLPTHIRERAFERFVRGGGDGGRGSGLGLAIVQAVAAAHGGVVHYSDREGGGACFTIGLPYSPLATPYREATTPRQPQAESSAGA